MYIPSLSFYPRPLASLCNLVQHSTMWYRPWKFNPHLVANKITQQKWFQIVLGWMCGGALWLFLHLLFFGITFSLSLCAVCDVGFWYNKCLGVFRCHVKPGEGHVLSEHSTTAGGGGLWGSKVWDLGVHSLCQGTRLQQIGHCARLTSLVKWELRLKQTFFFFFFSTAGPMPSEVKWMLRGECRWHYC